MACSNDDERVPVVEIDVGRVGDSTELHHLLRVRLVLVGAAELERRLPVESEMLQRLIADRNRTYPSWACELELR